MESATSIKGLETQESFRHYQSLNYSLLRGCHTPPACLKIPNLLGEGSFSNVAGIRHNLGRRLTLEQSNHVGLSKRTIYRTLSHCRLQHPPCCLCSSLDRYLQTRGVATLADLTSTTSRWKFAESKRVPKIPQAENQPTSKNAEEGHCCSNSRVPSEVWAPVAAGQIALFTRAIRAAQGEFLR